MGTPKRKPSDQELQGRQSGSVEWRQERGEIGEVRKVGNVW